MDHSSFFNNKYIHKVHMYNIICGYINLILTLKFNVTITLWMLNIFFWIELFSKVLLIYNWSKQSKYITNYNSYILDIKSEYFWSTLLKNDELFLYIHGWIFLIVKIKQGLTLILLLFLVCEDVSDMKNYSHKSK